MERVPGARMQDVTSQTNVLNLSNRTLTISEASLLSKGMSFNPQRHFNLFETILDINKFVKNVTIKSIIFLKKIKVILNLDFYVADPTFDLKKYTFGDFCAIRDLEELAQEGGSASNLRECEELVRPVTFKALHL